MPQIPIIDLFAGPGGLGEGFSSITDDNGERVFDIKLSIEKDEEAHKTLRLRSFFRQFRKEDVPEIYYAYIKENNLKKQAKLLEQLKLDYRMKWEHAENEAWKFELPYPEEIDKKTQKKKGYTPEQIEQRHAEIDIKIRERLNGNANWLLIGGPPCQAYSLAGRSRNQGISDSDHRVHLYKEYLRIIAKHHPAVFVMENVKGLLSAKIEGNKVFDSIKRDLKNPDIVFPKHNSPNYKIYSLVKHPDDFDEKGFPIYNNDTDFLIKSEKYGIPQRRHRVILLGIREDLGIVEFEPIPQSAEVRLKDVIDQLPKLRSSIGREIGVTIVDEKRKYKKVIDSHTYWLDTANNYLSRIKENHSTFDVCLNDVLNLDKGQNYIKCNISEENNPLIDWYYDKRIEGILNHETRTHLKEDIARYLFSSLYLRYNGDFPKLRDYPRWLLPDHKNAEGTKFADRFRTQRPGEPATTITSHISKDGHYFIHYDPEQCRSLTVREAARIQTFPDNYFFCGARTAQYHQVGNAVPPYLARQIGEVVKNIIQ